MDSQASDADAIGIYPVHSQWTVVDGANGYAGVLMTPHLVDASPGGHRGGGDIDVSWRWPESCEIPGFFRGRGGLCSAINAHSHRPWEGLER